MATFVAQSDFDFSVRMSTHTLAVKPGQTIPITVLVEAVKGEPRPILLTASDWRSAGLSAEIVPSTVPSGGVATLHVTVPLGTPPGSYLFTVRGATEGTFKTSNDSLTVVVEPDKEEKDNQDRKDANQDQRGAETREEPSGSPPSARAKRGVLARSAKTPSARQPAGSQRVGLIMIMAVMFGVLAYYIGTQLRSGSGGSISGMSGTYVGTSTFCINSVMGGSPECGTSNASIQIDSSGDVLGPVLFGKIDGSTFAGQANAGDGTTFPMTGTYSNGTLTARHTSSSVNWTITVHK